MSFDTDFIFQDGSRNAVAQMAVRFSNDSVATRLMRMSTNTHYSMEISNRDSLGIKDVRAFVYLSRDLRATQTTLNLLQVRNVRLMRCHIDKKKEVKPMQSQPANQPTTLKKESIDTLPAPRPVPATQP